MKPGYDNRKYSRAFDARWKARGNTKLNARITGAADDGLALLAAHYRLSRGATVNALLLAGATALLGHTGDAEIIALMHAHHFSRAEAELFRQALASNFSANLMEYRYDG